MGGLIGLNLSFVILILWTHAGYGQDRVAAAKAEKKLVLYHSPNVADTEKIFAGFRKKYPFIEAETYRGNGEKLMQKITTEVRAGRNLADVYLLSGFQTWLLKGMGLLLQYASPERDKVLDALKDSDGYWTGVYWNLEVLAYNSNLVRSSEVPKAWQDLLSPRWKAQIGFGGGGCRLVYSAPPAHGRRTRQTVHA